MGGSLLGITTRDRANASSGGGDDYDPGIDHTVGVYLAGMGESPAFREDTIALAMGQRAMVEFTLPQYGRYMFHPHQHWLADRGAMGWFAAV